MIIELQLNSSTMAAECDSKERDTIAKSRSNMSLLKFAQIDFAAQRRLSVQERGLQQ